MEHRPTAVLNSLNEVEPDRESQRDRRFATTLAKGLKVLQAFSPRDESVGVRELARRTGHPPSTIARMTFTLTHLGFLEHVPREDKYRLGPATMALGYTARANLSFLPVAEPLMQELADKTETLVALAMKEGDAAMLIRCWRPREVASIWLTEGHRLPLDSSSPGRAILAAQPQHLDDSTQVKEDRAVLISKGYISSLGGWNPNVNACAAPFYVLKSHAPYAFLCGAETNQLSQNRLETNVAPTLVNTLAALQRSLGLLSQNDHS